MKRPIGVTVIAVLNILGGFALAVNEMLVSPERPQGRSLGILIVVVLLGVGISVALLKLQNWARWVAIVFYALSLIAIPVRVIRAPGIADAVTASVPGLYLLWAVWYLFRPLVKAAFGRGRVS
ncbi:MAG TPA: hypothetical protein VK579_06120 [Terriglobales bacterium]|jgi:hypothetical protein|nr:hypothetical protein [Terriglobales bacterium]